MACHAARAVRRNKSVISVMIELLIIAAGVDQVTEEQLGEMMKVFAAADKD